MVGGVRREVVVRGSFMKRLEFSRSPCSFSQLKVYCRTSCPNRPRIKSCAVESVKCRLIYSINRLEVTLPDHFCCCVEESAPLLYVPVDVLNTVGYVQCLIEQASRAVSSSTKHAGCYFGSSLRSIASSANWVSEQVDSHSTTTSLTSGVRR